MKRIKKLTAILIAAALISGLTACDDPTGETPSDTRTTTSGADTTGTTDENPAPANPVGAVNGYTFPYRGTNIVLGSNVDDLFGLIGQPDDTLVEESCAFRGQDYTHIFPDIDITTFSPDGEAYHVLGIRLANDINLTENGAHIGMSREQIIARYGTPSETTETGRLFYRKDGMSLSFTFDGDSVKDIFYYFEDSAAFRIDGQGGAVQQ
jgi:hypothetical protein